MRLPRVALSRMRFSLDWIGTVADRTTWLYVGFTAILFLLFLVLTFPHDLIVRRVMRGVRGPVAVQFNSASFAWLKGYELSGIRLVSAQSDGQAPLLECTRAWVRPALRELVRGNPYELVLWAELYGGTANGQVRLHDGSLAGQVQFAQLDLGRYRTLVAQLEEGNIAGRVGGRVAFEHRGGNPDGSQMNGDITIDDAAVSAAKIRGFTVPDIRLRQARARFVLRGGRLEIQELQTVGDANIQGAGQVLLRDPLSDSGLNIRATVEQNVATPDAIKGLLALIPRPAGSRPDAPITITGTLSNPRLR